MGARAEDYRGYRLIIYDPSNPRDRWRVLIWVPGRGAPEMRPTFAAERDALRDAQTWVDKDLTRDPSSLSAGVSGRSAGEAA